MNSDDHINQELKLFYTNVGPFTKCFRSMNVRLMLIKINNRWQIAQGIIIMHPESLLKEKITTIIKSKLLKIIEVRLKPFQLEILCNQLIDGFLDLNQHGRYKFGKKDPIPHLNYWDYNREQAIKIFNVDTKIYTLKFQVNERENMIPEGYRGEIENLLRSNSIPFDGFTDLSKRFFLLGERPHLIYDNKNIYIWSPALIGINNDSRFQENGFKLSLWGDKDIELNKISIVTLEQTDKFEFKNRNIKIIKKNVRKVNGNFISINKTIKNPDYQIISAKIFLSYKDQFISLQDFYNPHFKTHNIGIKIIKNYNSLLEKYLDSLKGAKKEQAFENAIINLFGFCGYNSLPFDRIPGIKNFPDIIVLDPYEPRGMIIEITLGNISSDKKLDKLKNRYDNIKSIISEIDLIPVMITSKVSIDENEQKLAAEKQIAVLTIEDINLIFEYSKQLVTTGNIFNYIKNKIPPFEIKYQ